MTKLKYTFEHENRGVTVDAPNYNMARIKAGVRLKAPRLDVLEHVRTEEFLGEKWVATFDPRRNLF